MKEKKRPGNLVVAGLEGWFPWDFSWPGWRF